MKADQRMKTAVHNREATPLSERDTGQKPAAQPMAGLKICMVVHQDYYRDGRVRRYSESLADAGAQVDVLALRPPQPPASGAAHAGVNVFTIPLGRGYSGRGSYLVEYGVALLLFSIWLLGLYIRRRHQIIHVHNMPDFLIFSALVPRLLGAKLILDIHDPMPEFYQSKYASNASSKMVRIMRLQEKLSTWMAHAVITANVNFKENLIRRGVPAEKISVVNNIADLLIFDRARYPRKAERLDDAFVLLYPGTIALRYGLDIAIRAMPLLIPTIPEIRLLIVGPRVDHTEELAALAQELQVSDYVELRPAVPIHEVPRLMSQADLGIYPARSDAHMEIATPTKVLEFAAMGVPVVAAKLKILVKLFNDSTISFFDAGHVEQFAQRVQELYADGERRRQQVEAMDASYGRSHSWQYEREIYFKQLLNLIPELQGG
jgi:glycosyltransferase involved in cell wall biosynthesis